MEANSTATNRYSLDSEVDRIATLVVAALKRAEEGGEPDFGTIQVQKMRKIATLAMKADAANSELRFRPGSRLRTYTGVRDRDGILQDETYAGEAYLTAQSTIYRNIHAIHYGDDEIDPGRRGQPIRGRFEADGSFVEDFEGYDILYNEYANDDLEHPKRKYGIEPKPGNWTRGLSQITSYIVPIAEAKGEVLVKAGNGKLIAVKGGDFLVVDLIGDGKIGVHAIDVANKERTYQLWGSSNS